MTTEPTTRWYKGRKYKLVNEHLEGCKKCCFGHYRECPLKMRDKCIFRGTGMVWARDERKDGGE